MTLYRKVSDIADAILPHKDPLHYIDAAIFLSRPFQSSRMVTVAVAPKREQPAS